MLLLQLWCSLVHIVWFICSLCVCSQAGQQPAGCSADGLRGGGAEQPSGESGDHLEAGAAVCVHNHSKDGRSDAHLHHSEGLRGPGATCHGAFAATQNKPALLVPGRGLFPTMRHMHALSAGAWNLKCNLLWSIPVCCAFAEAWMCCGLFSKWVLFRAENDLVLSTVSRLTSFFCVVLLCSGVQ